MSYSEITFHLNQRYHTLLITELDQIGFDSFMEEDTKLLAYIDEKLLNIESIEKIKSDLKNEVPFTYTVGKLEDKNWNAEWEKNYDPVRVGNDVYIRAHFHESDPSVKHEVLITPQMSFGTGHHSTTSLVIGTQLNLDHQEKKVLDAGTGTGVLAIMASKLGAKSIDAYDIDEWSYNNAKENFLNNNISDIRLYQGDISVIEELNTTYDIILANINKNVLLADIPHFSKLLTKNGYLVLSGFYEKDIQDIEKRANEFQLELKYKDLKLDWTCLVFIKHLG